MLFLLPKISLSWIPWKFVIPFHLKTNFPILAGCPSYQIGWGCLCPNYIWKNGRPASTRKRVFAQNKKWRNYEFLDFIISSERLTLELKWWSADHTCTSCWISASAIGEKSIEISRLNSKTCNCQINNKEETHIRNQLISSVIL